MPTRTLRILRPLNAIARRCGDVPHPADNPALRLQRGNFYWSDPDEPRLDLARGEILAVEVLDGATHEFWAPER